MSENGVIIHLDDKKSVLEDFKSLFDQTDLDLEIITCTTKEKFKELVEEYNKRLRGLIFDLLSSEPDSEELHKKDAQFLDSVKEGFSNLSVPIFIYSGFLEALEGEFEENGTVFKIDKGSGPDEIIHTIRDFHESGFLDVFCPGGKIEKEIHKELHKSFTTQFTNNEQIGEIINLIKDASGEDDIKLRVEKVFKRIAIRSLLSGLKSSNSEDEEYVNPVEHYLQRINSQKVVTGDIFQSESEEECVLVLTPRCDLANKEPDDILVCEIDTDRFPEDTVSNKQKRKILDAITDNPKYSGYDRYLVRSPFFKGGLIKLSSYKMIKKEKLLADYQLKVSLSDELTNEILGKFGSYFFRTGITTWDWDETVAYLESIDD